MNLKTILFITLFLSAIVLSYQETTDAQTQTDEGLIDRARRAEKEAVAELKRQANAAKAQFKAAFAKLKASRTPAAGEDTSDSDGLIDRAITEANNVADQAKQTEWTGVRDLKAQAQKAKQAFKDAKDRLKASRAKSSSSSSSSSSDSSDTDAGEGVTDKVARAAEWTLLATLKEKSNIATAAVKAAYKKLRKIDDSSSSSSDSSDSDSTLKEKAVDAAKDKAEEVAVGAAGSVIDQAKEAQRTVYENLKAEAAKAKQAFQNAYTELKNRIRSEKSGAQAPEETQPPAPADASSSSSSSSDSSDSDGIIAKARRYSRQLLDQVERAKNQAYDAVRGHGKQEEAPKVDTEL